MNPLYFTTELLVKNGVSRTSATIPVTVGNIYVYNEDDGMWEVSPDDITASTLEATEEGECTCSGAF